MKMLKSYHRDSPYQALTEISVRYFVFLSVWLVTGEIIRMRVTFMPYCPSVAWKAHDKEGAT